MDVLSHGRDGRCLLSQGQLGSGTVSHLKNLPPPRPV